MTLKSIEKHLANHSFFSNPWLADMIADIEAEIAERFMELPLDADGVPIHVGDEMENGEYRGKVTDMSWDGHFWHVYHGSIAIAPCDYTHVKPRTVEDVLREYRHDALVIYDDPKIGGEDRADALEGLDEKVAAEIRDLLGGDGR